MDVRLNRRVALITGGSKGLGLGAAIRMAASGADVAIVARNPDDIDAALKTIRATAAARVEGFACDVADTRQINGMFTAVNERLGNVDILVNNAGYHLSGLFEEVSDEMWQEDIDLKLMAAIRLTRLALPSMKARRWGRIINVLNIFSKAPKAHTMPTCATRAATMAVTKALAEEVASYDVTVNGIVVGMIVSDQARRHYESTGTDQTFDQFLADSAERYKIPMGRQGRPEDFANMACFLASDAASYITGTAINVDGGLCPVV